MAQPTSAHARFAAIRKELARQLKELPRSQKQGDRNSPSPGNSERDTLIASENDIRELYSVGKRAQEEARQSGSSETISSPELVAGARSLEGTFFRRIIGDGPDDSRAKIFSILLFLQVDPITDLWETFVNTLRLDLDVIPQDGIPLASFCDAKLPLSPESIENVFGHDNAEQFDIAQHQHYPVGFQSSFAEDVKQLEGIIASYEVRCELGEGLARKTNDAFYPAPVPSEIVDKYAESIKSLYVESFKATLERLTSSNSSEIREMHRQLCDAKRKSEVFLDGVRACTKAFAILMLMKVHSDSDIWREFERRCFEGRQTTPSFRDDHIPLSYEDAEKLLGRNNVQPFLEMQYGFCAPALLEGRQIEFEHDETYMRLPLCEKKLIRRGGGSSGWVYCVKVEPRHFPSIKEGHYLAMKCAPMNSNNANEWESLKLIFEQPLTHKAIMAPRASLATESQIYIFSDKADCNLDEYMEDHDKRAAGPHDFEDRIRHFSQIVGIAEALQHLHCSLVEDHLRETVVIYHMDVKASNVLITEVNGEPLFQLTDFGISRMKSTPDDFKPGRDSLLIRRQPTKLRLGAGNPNSPPEADKKEGLVHSKADVWAFGTLLARFAAWLPGGYKTLIEFERTRGCEVDGVVDEKEFYEKDPTTQKPRMIPGVGQFFEKLIAKVSPELHQKERDLYESTWWLLKEKLLVCDEHSRADIRKVPKILKQILQSEPLDEIKRRDAQDAPLPNETTTAQPPNQSAHRTDPLPQSNAHTGTPMPTADPESNEDRDIRASVVGITRTETMNDIIPARRASTQTMRTARTAPPMGRTSSNESTGLPVSRSATEDPEETSTSRTRNWNPFKSRGKNAVPSHKNNDIRRRSRQEELVLAIRDGNLPAFRHALGMIPQSDLDHPVQECTALEHAVIYDRKIMVEELLENDANIRVAHPTHGTLLHRASIAGMSEMMRLLLKNGIDINAKDAKKISSLSRVSQRRPEGFHDVLQCLLEHEAIDIKVRDSNNATPLIRAAEHGDIRAVDMLLRAGASIYAKDKDGYTTLHHAISFDGTLTKTLLNADKEGTLVHMETNKGRTALHLCADLASPEALANAKILLDNEANVNAEDKADETPLDLATDKTATPDHSNMVELLIDKRAYITATIKADSKRHEFDVICERLRKPSRQLSYQKQ